MTCMDTSVALNCLARTQDPAAWEYLIETHGPAMYRACLGVLGNAHLAEDALQDALLIVRDRAETFRGTGIGAEAAAKAWLRRVACTSALQLARQSTARKRREHRSEQRTQHEPEPEADERILKTETFELIRTALASMTDRQRLPLVLHYYGGLGYEELANELQCTVNSARVRLHRSLNKLRLRLTHIGVVLSLTSISTALDATVAAANHEPLPAFGSHIALLSSSKAPAATNIAALSGGGISGLGKLSIALLTLLLAILPIVAIQQIDNNSQQQTLRIPEQVHQDLSSGARQLDPATHWQQQLDQVQATKAAFQSRNRADADTITARITTLAKTYSAMSASSHSQQVLADLVAAQQELKWINQHFRERFSFLATKQTQIRQRLQDVVENSIPNTFIVAVQGQGDAAHELKTARRALSTVHTNIDNWQPDKKVSTKGYT